MRCVTQCVLPFLREAMPCLEASAKATAPLGKMKRNLGGKAEREEEEGDGDGEQEEEGKSDGEEGEGQRTNKN